MVINPTHLQANALLSGRQAFADVGEPMARPFVKWVGGKGQLVSQLDANLPEGVRNGSITNYIEPFVGGGALFFHVAHNYPVKRFILSDNNTDLILAYWTVRERVGLLITSLHDLQTRYLRLAENRREEFYYRVRKNFNSQKSKIDLTHFSDDWIERTTQLIFLNKTCFNGLFRVNSHGEFNVAFGKYDNPKISDPDNLIQVAQTLKAAEILLADFEQVIELVQKDSFVYLDPPYRPLTETANFTGYSPNTFTALDQERLAQLCQKIDDRGAKVLLSNSDPANVDPDDRFFEHTYPGFRIVTTAANRMVNCRADRRGKISELFIMNYGDGKEP